MIEKCLLKVLFFLNMLWYSLKVVVFKYFKFLFVKIGFNIFVVFKFLVLLFFVFKRVWILLMNKMMWLFCWIFLSVFFKCFLKFLLYFVLVIIKVKFKE